MLTLREKIVTHLVRLGFHIVFLAITEAVGGESRLERVLLRELVDTTSIPSEAFVAHLIVSTSRDVSPCVGTVSTFMGIVETDIQSQFVNG